MIRYGSGEILRKLQFVLACIMLEHQLFSPQEVLAHGSRDLCALGLLPMPVPPAVLSLDLALLAGTFGKPLGLAVADLQYRQPWPPLLREPTHRPWLRNKISGLFNGR
jgi:hypothetical protein